MINYLERLHHQTTIGEIKVKRYLFEKKTHANSHFNKVAIRKNVLKCMTGYLELRPKVIVDPRQIDQIGVHKALKIHG